MAGPYTPGTAYGMFHHLMGETDGQRGVWAYVQGGMGTVTQAMAKFLESRKGEILDVAPTSIASPSRTAKPAAWC